MSATLGALVIAIATEFSVILAARYHEERGAGPPVGEALRRAYARTGAAVLASGVTAIAGFARARRQPTSAMLRDFGLVTVVDLARRAAGRDAGAAGRAGLGRGAASSCPRARAVAASARPSRAAAEPGAAADGVAGRRARGERADDAEPAARPAPLLAVRRARLPRPDRGRRRQHADDRRRRASSARRPRGAACRCPSSRFPTLRGGARAATPTSPRTTATTAREPLSRGRPAHARLRGRPAGARSGSATSSTGRW